MTRTVVLTGASGNLGRAVAAAFADANLVLLDVKSPGESAKQIFIQTNLIDPQSVQAAADKTLQRFGRVDVLCNLAGGFRMGAPLHETSPQDWDFLFNLTARTVLHTAKAFVPAMLKGGGGKIVNVGAYAAQKGAARMGAYIASKSAVIRLTE